MKVADATPGAGKPADDTARNGCNSAVTPDPAALALGGVQCAASVTTRRRPTVSTTVPPLDSSPTLVIDPAPGGSGGNDFGIDDPPPREHGELLTGWRAAGALPAGAPVTVTHGSGVMVALPARALPETAPSVPAARVAAGAHPASSTTPAIPTSQPRVNRSTVETVITTALAGTCNHHPLSRRRGVTHSFPLTSVK
jgi:hypothetical protein